MLMAGEAQWGEVGAHRGHDGERWAHTIGGVMGRGGRTSLGVMGRSGRTRGGA